MCRLVCLGECVVVSLWRCVLRCEREGVCGKKAVLKDGGVGFVVKYAAALEKTDG